VPRLSAAAKAGLVTLSLTRAPVRAYSRDDIGSLRPDQRAQTEAHGAVGPRASGAQV